VEAGEAAYPIQAESLARRFGKKTAVNSVDFRVRRGEIYGLLGPNGAGKTTAVRLLSGLISPSGGQALIHGRPAPKMRPEDKRRVGVMLEELGFFRHLSLREHLMMGALVYGVPRSEAVRGAEELLRRLGVWDERDTAVGHASTGTQKKLALALALIHHPDILLLDEPFKGLDIESFPQAVELLRQAAQSGAAVFLTSHALGQMNGLLDSCGVLLAGRLAGEETTDTLMARGSDVLRYYRRCVGLPRSD